MRISVNAAQRHSFRSSLEKKVAIELDRLNVDWTYEQPPSLPPSVKLGYLPDFTIHDAPDWLELPSWIECKPQEWLYDLRDDIGVTRKAGEYFQQDVHADADSEWLRREGFKELWKPKRLAELTGEAVLVIGGVGGRRRLSILMDSDELVFSRSQPFVNAREAERQKERERKEQEARKDRARQACLRAGQRVQMRSDRVAAIRRIAAQLQPKEPRYPSVCYGCNSFGADGKIYRANAQGGEWIRVCAPCQSADSASLGDVAGSWREFLEQLEPQLLAFLMPAKVVVRDGAIELRFQPTHRFHYEQLRRRKESIDSRVQQAYGLQIATELVLEHP